MGHLFDYINWIAVLVAALAYFALGALWYSKLLFAKRWMSDLKIDANNPDASKGIGMMFGGSFVLMFVQVLAVAILMGRVETGGWMGGAKVGAFVGCCFCAAAVGVNYLYEKKPLSLFLINAGYAIVGNALAGAVLGMWPNG